MNKDMLTPALRILVVDDNQDAADSLCMVLRMLGHTVEAVYDGSKAIYAARTFEPDCMVLDIGLPGIDGFRLAEQVRADDALKDIGLIAVSAYAEEPRAREVGFDQYFVKPIDPLIVEKMLRRLREMGRQLAKQEKLMVDQGEVITEARELMKEVKEDVKELKQELREVKEDIKEIKQELKDGHES